MSFDLTVKKNPLDAKRAAIEAAKASAGGAAAANPAALIRYIPAGECPDRNRIVFDDSGSMSWAIEQAKTGVVEYLRNCIPNQTSVAIHWMNTQPALALQSDLVALAVAVQEIRLESGYTPFFNTLKDALEAKPVLTRLIAFTDGSPTDSLEAERDMEMETTSTLGRWLSSANIIIKIAKATSNGIPIDTVYFGDDSQQNKREIDLLKYLSAETGGYFLHFNPSKVNFATAFKYLAPVNRLRLASSSFRASLESGAQK